MDNAAKEEAVFDVDVSIAIDVAKSKAVQNRDRPRAHADDVTDDATDAGCRTVEWFDISRGIAHHKKTFSCYDIGATA